MSKTVGEPPVLNPLLRLAWPLLPPDVRNLLAQQGIDQAADRKAIRVFSQPGVTVTALGSIAPGASSAEPLALRPIRSASQPKSAWFAKGRLDWDGKVLTVTASEIARFRPAGGGIRPEFQAEQVARNCSRPVPPSARCPASVVEIAAVAVRGNRMQRLYFLDEASRHLTMTPAFGLVEDDVAELARRAGIGFRVYWVTTGTMPNGGRQWGAYPRLSPQEVCEAVFPRSAQRRPVVDEMSRIMDWQASQDWL